MDKAKIVKGAAATFAAKKGIKLLLVIAVLTAVGKVLTGRGR